MHNRPVEGLPTRISATASSICLSLMLAVACPAFAAPGTSPKTDAGGSIDSATEESESSAIDYIHEVLSTQVAGSGAWLDEFFDDPTYSDEENLSSLRLTLSSMIEDGEDADFGAKFRLRLALPRWEDRLQLIASGDSEDSDLLDENAEEDDLELGRDGERSLALGLRYTGKQTTRQNLSLGGGVRFRDGSLGLFIQPRYRYFKDLGTWDTRFIQKVTWYEPTGFESLSTLQFERMFGDEYFFRTTGKLNWYEDEEGWFPRLNFTVRKALSRNRVLAVEWNNYFETELPDPLESSVVKVRYRQRIYRRWLWFEVAPQVSFPHDEDYEAKPGILFELEAFFGLGHLKNTRLPDD